MSDDRKSISRHNAVVSGCLVTSDDLPLIIASIACFITFLVYGACASSLGAAIPQLSTRFNQSESSFGLAFTTRGIGYLVGTLASAALIELPTKKISKSLLVCAAISVTGLSTGIIAGIDNFKVILFLFWIQGLGFGGVDTCANCVMPELWGLRVGPWMQGLHSFFGIGAVVGPSLVGGIGYQYTFILLALASFLPLLLMFIFAVTNRRLVDTSNNPIDESKLEEANDSTNITTADVIKSESIKSVPLSIKICITLFFFIYVGSETGYGGWITTYALQENLTQSQNQAAYLASYFWAALAFGRIVAIPLAIFLSTTLMLRIQLTLSLIASVLVVTVSYLSYNDAIAASVMYGYALSSIFPLAMTLVNDYGFTMDATTTTLFVVGSTCGEAIIPIGIGFLIDSYGPISLTYCILSLAISLIILYVIVHYISSYIDLNNGNEVSNNDKNSDIKKDDIEIVGINPIHE